MATQAIFYDETGKVHTILDPMGDYELPSQADLASFVLAKGFSILPGHGVVLYEKSRDQAKRVQLGPHWHEFYDWQAAVDRHLGKV